MARLARPHAMLAMNVVAADTDAEAARLFTTQQQAFANLRGGRPGLVPRPLASAAELGSRYDAQLLATVDEALSCAAVGAPATVRGHVAAFIARHQPDELIFTANIHDPAARLRSFELAMDAVRGPG